MNEKNKYFIEKTSNIFPALKHFEVRDNRLIFDNKYIIHIDNTDLSSLNPRIFLLNPGYIINIIQLFELLHYKNLNEKYTNFVRSYVDEFYKLRMKNEKENNVDPTLLWCLELPFYIAEEEMFKNNNASIIIGDCINENNNKIESEMNSMSNEKIAVRVLKKDDFSMIPVNDNVSNFEQAGYASIFIITLAIASACTFIALFIASH